MLYQRWIVLVSVVVVNWVFLNSVDVLPSGIQVHVGLANVEASNAYVVRGEGRREIWGYMSNGLHTWLDLALIIAIRGRCIIAAIVTPHGVVCVHCMQAL